MNNKTTPIEQIFIMIKKYVLPFVALFVIIVGSYNILISENDINAGDLNIVNGSSGEWVSSTVITIDTSKIPNKIVEYSIDGGNTWSTSNSFTIEENKTLNVRVKSNNRESTDVVYNVTNIDDIKPIIIVNVPTTVKLGEKVDLTVYEAYDNESGLDEEVRISPNEIDTSSEGHKIVTYTAVDKVGNVKELVYSINVVK